MVRLREGLKPPGQGEALMITAFYTAARIALMVGGWLVALAFAFAADYMLAGARWPIFVCLGSWWTLTCILYMRREAERSGLYLSRRILRGLPPR
jgi:hypothetical protein